MKLTNMKISSLVAAIILTFCSFGVYALETPDEPPMNKDQVEGRTGEFKGKVKEATGVITDDKKMEVEGNVQKNVGKAQKNYGDVKKDIEQGK